MYCRQNNQNASRKQCKKLALLVITTLLFAFSGCAKQQEAKVSHAPKDTSVSVANETTLTPSPKPTPTIKPSASITIGEELSVTDAKAILEEHLNNSKYSIDLLSESVDIDNTHFIAFIASENANPLEPVLVVNKFNGKVSCLSKEGNIISFHNFPTNSNKPSVSLDWNGTYYRKDKYDHIVSTLSIVQNDSSSLEFIVQSKDNITAYTLAGIGHITENNAFFTDENNHELLFVLQEDSITLYDNEAFNNNGLSINGSYYFATYEDTNSIKITLNQATELVSSLSMEKTKLPAEISEYELLGKPDTIIVKDRICYEIGAYAKLEDHNVLMTTFYVSIDGNVAFAFDSMAKNTYTAIKLMN